MAGAGVVIVIEVGEDARIIAGRSLNNTATGLLKPFPVITAGVPPNLLPLAGVIRVTDGALLFEFCRNRETKKPVGVPFTEKSLGLNLKKSASTRLSVGASILEFPVNFGNPVAGTA